MILCKSCAYSTYSTIINELILSWSLTTMAASVAVKAGWRCGGGVEGSSSTHSTADSFLWMMIQGLEGDDMNDEYGPS